MISGFTLDTQQSPLYRCPMSGNAALKLRHLISIFAPLIISTALKKTEEQWLTLMLIWIWYIDISACVTSLFALAI